MAYVEPNGTIQLFENIPIDSSYRNTFWFNSIADQTNYFNSLGNTHVYTKCYYTRKNRGYVRVKDLADNLYTCNYMRFNNLNHHNKWIYCFITSVDYINENTTQINYEIDLIQTYMFDVKIRNSFVERQHSFTDEIGDNLVVEELDTGNDYMVEKHGNIITLYPNRIGFVSSRQLLMTGSGTGYNKTQPGLSVINGVFTRSSIMIVKVPTTQYDLTNLTNSLNFAFSGISDDELPFIFMYNSVLDSLVTSLDMENPANVYAGNFIVPPNNPRCISSNSTVKQSVTPGITLSNKFGDYTPKNKKLLTYPYKYFEVNGADHDSQDYKYELFMKENGSRDIHFILEGAIFPYPQYLLVPKNYLGFNTQTAGYSTYYWGYECAVHITDYINVPWATDVFKGYLLQTRGSRSFAIAKTIANMGSATKLIGGTANYGMPSDYQFKGGMRTVVTPTGSETVRNQPYERPEAEGVVQNTGATKSHPFGLISSMYVNGINAKGMSNGMHGSFNSDGILAGADRYKFEYLQYCIKPEYAKMIDDYFTAYGYAQKQYMGVISPSSENVIAKTKRRKLWNFTKTIGCNVIATQSVVGCTAEEIDKIADIYDNGITFWETSQPVGSYNGDNSPRA